MVTVKAPGKLMLMGEHAVVYGYPCLVTAVNRYLTVEAEENGEKNDQLVTPETKDQSFLKATLRYFRERYKIGKGVRLSTKSELGKYGLGSSAATVVATLKALALLYKIKIADNELFDLGLKIVLSVQGQASGFDLAASLYGGTLYFDGKTKGVIPLTHKLLPLLTVFSGKKAETVPMIQMVKKKRENDQKGIEAIFKGIETLVKEAKISLGEKNWPRLGTLMNYNQNYLEDLGVSTPELNNLIQTAREAGAYGAKLSGAGGGDCLIALVSPEKKETVTKALEEAKGEVIDIQSGTGKTL